MCGGGTRGTGLATAATKLFHLLSPGQRRRAAVLLGLMFVGMLFETLGIGLVIPAFALMTQADVSLKYPWFAGWIGQAGNPSRATLVAWGMAALVVVYLTKAAFLALLAWYQARFVYQLQAGLSRALFAGYLRQPYAFHLQRNSAELIRNAIGQVADVTTVAQQALLLLTELLVLLGILVLLIYVEPFGALVVGAALAGAAWGFHRLSRNCLVRWGGERQYHEGKRIQHIQQGLGGIKEVQLLGREDDFLREYDVHNLGSAWVGQRQTTLQALPRLWLELLAIVGLAALVFGLIGQNKPVDSILPTLGVFAAAAFRIIPSVNRVLIAVQNFRFSSPAIESLDQEITGLSASPPLVSNEPLLFCEEIRLDNITYTYPAAAQPALRGVCLDIHRGTSVGIIGGSGAGKSTLVDVLLGLLSPESGTVTVDGKPIHRNLRAWRDLIGYVPQFVFLTDDSLRRNVAFGLADSCIDDGKVWDTLRAAQLEDFARALPAGLNTSVGERGVSLSGGQRQRIGIARALYHDPAILVLDEATSSLDVATEEKVMEAVRLLHGKKTVVIIAHRLSTVSQCDWLFRIEHGVVVEAGSAATVLGMHVPLAPPARVDKLDN